jgi:hypothetical protein
LAACTWFCDAACGADYKPPPPQQQRMFVEAKRVSIIAKKKLDVWH